MIAARDVATALYGAFQLARFRPKGMAFFDTSLDGFWRSFFAAVLVAPLYIALVSLRADEGLSLGSALIDALAYTINWLAFPVVMLHLTAYLDRRSRYIPAIVAYNWTAVLQNLVFLPLAILGALGTIDTETAAFLSLLVLGWTLLFTGYVLHVALDLPPQTAAVLVAIDLVLGITINALAAGAV